MSIDQGPWPKHRDRSGTTRLSIASGTYAGVWQVPGSGLSWKQLMRKIKDGEAIRGAPSEGD